MIPLKFLKKTLSHFVAGTFIKLWLVHCPILNIRYSWLLQNISRSWHFRKIKSTEAQLSKITYNSKSPTDTEYLYSFNDQDWLPCQILDCKTAKNIQINPQTTKIWQKQLLNVALSMSDTLFREKLSV